jgi:hypothetical protein
VCRGISRYAIYVGALSVHIYGRTELGDVASKEMRFHRSRIAFSCREAFDCDCLSFNHFQSLRAFDYTSADPGEPHSPINLERRSANHPSEESLILLCSVCRLISAIVVSTPQIRRSVKDLSTMSKSGRRRTARDRLRTRPTEERLDRPSTRPLEERLDRRTTRPS